MNKQELDLLNIIKKEAYVNQRQLSEASGYSLGKVNTSLAELVKAGYLNADYRLTEQAEELFTENRPNQAVILAAGAGMRMIPINTEVSKGMLEVRGETLVERLIKQLKEKGIHKITIVVGFMKEQYEYLIDEYGVELVYNKEYAVKNNLFSLAKVKDRLENAYIVPCDLWCRTNPFSETELYSWYMIDEMTDEDSTIRMNRKMELKAVGDSEAGNHMVGIAYINKESARTLEQKISEMKEHRRYYNSFWEDAAMEKGKMILNPSVTGLDFSYSKNDKAKFGVGAQVGTFFAEGIALMVNAGADWSKPVDEYTLGTGVRFYFNKTGIYLGGGLDWNRFRWSGGKHQTDWGLGIEAGYAYFLSRTVTIEPAVYYKWRFNDGDMSRFGVKIGFGFYL